MAYNMDMANLPALRSKSTDPDRFVEALTRQMAAGVHPRDIARKMYPKAEDRGRRNSMYARLRRLALDDPRVARGLAEDARLEMMVALPQAARAMSDRAGRGRIDAVKLLFESSGFHNPKVKHEHSGEIKVKLEMPRPNYDHVADAEVVDD